MSNTQDNENKIKETLAKLVKYVDVYIKNPEKVDELLKSLADKQKIADAVTEKIKDFPEMVNMVKDYFSKKYTVVPVKSILLTLAAILYVVNPFDLISDLLGPIGWTDDIAVCGAALKSIDTDLQEYKKWKSSQISD